MNRGMMAIMKKDFYGVIENKRLFITMLIVPLVLTLVVPTIFIFGIHFAPGETDLNQLLKLLRVVTDMEQALYGLFLNYIMPIFFLVIPVMTSSITAATSFVGEKEKRTLETLLYCPLTLRQIFIAKVLASFSLSILVSFISFLAMAVVLEIELVYLTGSMLLPSVSWVLILFLVGPAISLIAVTLIVRGSAKAQTVEESQQSAVFLVLPIVLLIVGQFTGMMLVNARILLGIGVVSVVLAWVLLGRAVKRFHYERLLK